MWIIKLISCFWLMNIVDSSTLGAPPHSAVIVTFEDVYDLSILANSLSDQGIDTTLIVPASNTSEVYNNMIDVELLTLSVENLKTYPEKRAIQLCEALLKDAAIAKKILEIQPTFTIFPALRHDGCLLPWARSIGSIPVIYTRNREEELYVFEYTGKALRIQNTGFWTRFVTCISWKSAGSEYAAKALRTVGEHLPDTGLDLENLYADVDLILWGADIVLRSDFAPLTQFIVEVGCHHCRPSLPLNDELHKSLIEFRLGTIAVLLDENYEVLIKELAQKLPQGRHVGGQAVVWRNTKLKESIDSSQSNLFVQPSVDRQDLIGYGRTRMVLSHCTDTELLEAAFHGTPLICFPRNSYESENAARAIQLGFARSFEDSRTLTSEELANTVKEIHENMNYRENARKVSLAIRDRINPPSDRMIYWLRYTSRTKDWNLDFLTPISPAITLKEEVQLFITFFVIAIVCMLLGIAWCLLVTYLNIFKKTQRSKGRYKQ